MTRPFWYVVFLAFWIAVALVIEASVVFHALSHLLSTVIGGAV